MKHDPESGFTLIEVLVAMALLAIGLLAIAAMQIHFAEGNTRSRQLIHATDIGLNKIGELTELDADDPKLDKTDPDDPDDRHEPDDPDSTYPLDYNIYWDVTEDTTDTGEDILIIDLSVEWKTGDQDHSVSFDWIRPG